MIVNPREIFKHPMLLCGRLLVCKVNSVVDNMRDYRDRLKSSFLIKTGAAGSLSKFVLRKKDEQLLLLLLPVGAVWSRSFVVVGFHFFAFLVFFACRKLASVSR